MEQPDDKMKLYLVEIGAVTNELNEPPQDELDEFTKGCISGDELLKRVNIHIDKRWKEIYDE